MKVIINCGECGISWYPGTFSGGSEEQAILLAKVLSSSGHDVTVYNSIQSTTYYQYGNYRVEYRNYKDFANNECDVYFGWRNPKFFTNRYAKTQILLSHDAPRPNNSYLPDLEAIKNGAMDNIDYVNVLNLYHYDLHLKMECPKEKLLLIPIVVEENHYLNSVEKNWFKCIWSSHPNRGIKHLRNCWDRIKNEVPQAILQPCWWDENGRHEFVAPDETMGILPTKICNHDELNKELASSFCLPYCSMHDIEISPASCLKSQNSKVLPIVIAKGGMQSSMGNSGEIYCDENNFTETIIQNLKLSQSEKENKVNIFETNLSKHRPESVRIQWEIFFYNNHTNKG